MHAERCHIYSICVSSLVFIAQAVFTMRRKATAVLVIVLCLSHASIVSKRLNVESRKENYRSAQDPSFQNPEISSKFEWDHRQRGRQMQGGRLESATFDK